MDIRIAGSSCCRPQLLFVQIYSFPHSIGPSVFLSVQTTTSRFVLDNSYSCNQTNNPLDHSHSFNSTWSYENRVSKHFVIFRHMFTVLFFDICLLCCLLMSVFSSCFVAMDLCRSGCRQNYYLTSPPTPPPPSDLFSLPTILSLTQVTVI